MSTWARNISVLIVIACILWIAISSFSAYPAYVNASLASSTRPDREAVQVSDLLRGYIPLNVKTTVLYLNGWDGGDNYYRVRYLLYPVHFIDYWSWSHPNAGGRVWNSPQFSTESGLRNTLIHDKVNFVVALHQPLMMHLIGRSGVNSQGIFLFRIDLSRLQKYAPLKTAFFEVGRWV